MSQAQETSSSATVSSDTSVTQTESSTPLGDTDTATSSSSSSSLRLLCRRLWVQKLAWFLHFNKHSLGITFGLSYLLLALTLILLRCFSPVGDLPSFFISASVFCIFSFLFLWTAIPESPPFLATPTLEPIFIKEGWSAF